MKISVFTSSNPVGKKITLNADGTLTKTLQPQPITGDYHQVDLPDTPEGISALMQIKEDPCSCITAGVSPVHTDCTFVTKDKAANDPNVIARSTKHLEWPEGPAVMILDTDSHSAEEAPGAPPPLTDPDDVALWLQEALGSEELLGVTLSSSSCGIVKEWEDGAEDDEYVPLSADDRWHSLIGVVDGTDIPRAIAALHSREILAGRGYVFMNKNGLLSFRSRIDTKMASVNQPAFGAPTVGPGLEHAVIELQYDGVLLDTAKAIPNLTDTEVRHLHTAEAKLRSTFARVNKTEIARRQAKQVTQIAKTSGRSERDVRKMLAAGESAPITASMEVAGKTAQYIYEHPEQYRDKDVYCPDPYEPEYGKQGLLIKANTEGPGFHGKVFNHGANGKIWRSLYCTLAFALDQVAENFVSKTAPKAADKAMNTATLPEGWAGWCWCLEKPGERAALLHHVKAFTTCSTDELRELMDEAKPPEPSAMPWDGRVQFTEDGLELIRVGSENTNSAVAKTFAHLKSTGVFFQNSEGHITGVHRGAAVTTEDKAREVGLKGTAPVPGLPLAMTSYKAKGPLRAVLSQSIQYVIGGKLAAPSIPLEGDVAHSPDKPLPRLKGVSTLPILTPTGVLTKEGCYNGTYLCMDPTLEASIPADEDCNITTAKAALTALIDGPLGGFAFIDSWGPFAAVSAMMMMLARDMLGGSMPATIITANDVNAGKSTLCKFIIGIPCGWDDSRDEVWPTGKASEYEMANVLVGNAMAGAPYLYFDQVPKNTAVGSELLTKLITAEHGFEKRVITAKYNQHIKPLPILLNGNQIGPGAEMLRRTIVIHLANRPVGTHAKVDDLALTKQVNGYRNEGLSKLYTLLRFGQLVEADTAHPQHALLQRTITIMSQKLDGFGAFKRIVAGVLAMTHASYGDEEKGWQLDMEKLQDANICQFFTVNKEHDVDAEKANIAKGTLLALFGTRQFSASEVVRRVLSDKIGNASNLPVLAKLEVKAGDESTLVWRCNPEKVKRRAIVLGLDYAGRPIARYVMEGFEANGGIKAGLLDQPDGIEPRSIGSALAKMAADVDKPLAGFELVKGKDHDMGRYYQFVSVDGDYDKGLWADEKTAKPGPR